MEKMMQKWQSFKDEIRLTVVSELRFNYDSLVGQDYGLGSFFMRFAAERRKAQQDKAEAIKEKIIEALSMWKFIAKYFVWEKTKGETTKEKWENRRKDLSVLLAANTDNYYIQLLIMLESMPTPAFRKIIWSYNIDFMSLESFFRRLTETQRVGIATAYREFWHNQIVPEIFPRRGWFAKKVSREDLLSTEFNERVRYASAGSMSYNLLGMDFGFNAYPKGINDDTKIVEISPLRFLSVKNHADDFIVNQEDGIYFRLYKAARSNYVICPDKKVELKTHVCPGFWYTMIVHFIFWVVSPLWAISSLSTWLAGGFSPWPWYLIVLSVLPGVVTPLWLFLAGVKYLVNKYLSKAVKAVNEFYCRHKKSIADKFFVILIIAIGLSLLQGIGALYRLIQIQNGSELIQMSIFLLWALLWLVRGTIHVVVDINKWEKPESWLRRVRISIWVLASILFANLIFGLRYQIWNFVIAAAIWIYGLIYGLLAGLVVGIMMFFQATGLLALVLLIPVAIAIIVWRLDTREKKAKIGKIWMTTGLLRIVNILTFLFFAASVLMSLYAMVSLSWSVINIFILIIAAAVGVSLFIESVVIWSMKPEVRQASDLVSRLNDRFRFRKSEERIDREEILKNPWLISLPPAEREKQVDKILDLVFSFFDYCQTTRFRYTLKLILRHMNGISLGMIQKALGDLRGLKGDISKYDVFAKMVFGHDFSKAVSLVADEMEKEKAFELMWEKRWLKTKKVFRTIFHPLALPFVWVSRGMVWIMLGVVWLVDKAIEFFKTFYRLYQLFNKRCPYVAPVRRLNL